MSKNLPIKYKENIFKKIINKIKSLYGKNKDTIETQQITNMDNNSNRVDSNKLYRDSQKVNQKQLNLQEPNQNKEIMYEKESIEYALDQFNKSLGYQYQENGQVNPYTALIELGARKIEYSEGNNIIESKLINVLENDNRFEVTRQNKPGTDETYFYHIQTERNLNEGLEENADKMRLYLNCKRKNVAKLATKLAQNFKDDNMYFKFSSDYQLGNLSRSEAFVIYTDTKNVANIMNKLNVLHDENVELFEGSENMNPFLKTEAGYISYAPEPKTNAYNKMDGKTETIDPSYNTFLSKALKESFVRAARETIARDKQLTEKTDGVVTDDINFYAKYFNELKQRDYAGFIKQMKKNLKEETKRNNVLDIKGLDDKQIEGGKDSYDER